MANDDGQPFRNAAFLFAFQASLPTFRFPFNLI
jgi:hypothetical protein